LAASKKGISAGDLVLVQVLNPSKLEERQRGPFKVISELNGRTLLQNLESNAVIERDVSQLCRYFEDKNVEVSNKNLIPEEIVEERTISGETEYLVRWKGFGSQNDSWRPSKFFKKHSVILNNWKGKKVKLSGNSEKVTIIDESVNELKLKQISQKDVVAPSGIFNVIEVIAHEPSRASFKFYVKTDHKRFASKILKLNLGQIENAKIVERYMKERGLFNPRDDRKDFNLRGGVGYSYISDDL